MKKAFYLFLLVITFFASCTKKNIPDAIKVPGLDDALKGGLIGTIFPSSAVKRVNAISVAGTDSASALPDTLGNYKISGLKSGTYAIRFDVDPGYLTKENVRILITAGKEFEMGKLVFAASDSANPGSISGRISPANGAVRVQISDRNFNLKYSVIPDQDGKYQVDKVNPGFYQVSCVSAIGYAPPGSVSCTVDPARNTLVSTLTCTPVSQEKKAIDTIAGLYSVGTIQEINNFITRAAADSAIVFTGSFFLRNSEMVPDLAAALDKIIAVKGGLEFSFSSTTVVSFKGLTETGQFRLINTPNLASLNLSGLKKLNGLQLRNCPALSSIDFSSLKQFSGDLMLANTGFRDLSLFSSIPYSPFELEISYNQQLTTMRGLNFSKDSLYNCTITSNSLLTDLSGLEAIKRVNIQTVIFNNPMLKSLTGLENIVAAKRLTLSNNAQLTEICSARKMLTLLRNTPDYQEYYYDRDNRRQVRTITALTASNNGNFVTKADLVTAIGNCR